MLTCGIVRDLVYDRIQEKRPGIHCHLAEALAHVADSFGWKDLAEIGRQFDAGENPAEAAKWYLKAEDAAAAEQDQSHAIQLYRNAMRSAGERHALQMDIQWKLSETYWNKGEHKECLDTSRALFEAIDPGDPRFVPCSLRIGKALTCLGKNAEAIDYLASGWNAFP